MCVNEKLVWSLRSLFDIVNKCYNIIISTSQVGRCTHIVLCSYIFCTPKRVGSTSILF
jgi:hypothetical protein